MTTRWRSPPDSSSTSRSRRLQQSARSIADAHDIDVAASLRLQQPEMRRAAHHRHLEGA